MEYQKILLGENSYFISYVQTSYPNHCHNEIEVLYCLHGNAKVIVETQEYTLNEGSILFVSSLAAHQLIIEGDAAVFAMEFGSQLLGNGYNEFAERCFANCLISPDDDCPYKDYILQPVKKLYYEYANHEKGAEWSIRSGLLEIFAMMVRYLPMQAKSPEKKKGMDQYMRIQKVFDLVQSEYDQEITLERAAAHVGYGLRAFCRLFKSITNMTFHDYLNSYRINVSMRLLEYKAYSISTVGQMAGIPVAKTFSRLFRKYTGMSPSEYRNTFLKNF